MSSMPWFRMYHEFATDPKVQTMPEYMQRRLVMLMCMRCGGVSMTDEYVAFSLRLTTDEVRETKTLFVDRGFIDRDWKLRNWDKRQFASDSSTARVQRHRDRKKQGQPIDETNESPNGDSRNGDETAAKRFSNDKVSPPDTDTDTDTEAEAERKTTMTDPPAAAPSGSGRQNRKREQYTQDFEQLWAVYPTRCGDAAKPAAFEQYRSRLKEGFSHQDMLDSTRRYRAWVEASGKLGLETVMQAKRFLGRDKPFLNAWAPPKSPVTNSPPSGKLARAAESVRRTTDALRGNHQSDAAPRSTLPAAGAPALDQV